jgi:hypothetical protein
VKLKVAGRLAVICLALGLAAGRGRAQSPPAEPYEVWGA